ncbi:hypothetical protein [Streptomyces hokutonensis]|uniref:Uncharacterized protein n=1 Tax=Streptomyces hokutonensis TaxID=1306990 RepID=A0ABW6MI87_9ACTN
MSETYRQILLDDTLTEFMASHIDKFGTPEAYNHDAVGWAHAMDTPCRWTKQVASQWGGIRNGTGNRGIHHKGWSAVTKHRTPWAATGSRSAFDDDVWEPYDGSTGRAEFAYNLCALDIAQGEAERPLPSGEHQVRHGTPVTRPARAMTPYQGEGSWTIRC